MIVKYQYFPNFIIPGKNKIMGKIPNLRWHVTYFGKPDKYSATRNSQPSWSSFDKRVWEAGDYRLELTKGFGTPKNKIGCYIVILDCRDVELLSARGTNWQLLVKLGKQYACESKKERSIEKG